MYLGLTFEGCIKLVNDVEKPVYGAEESHVPFLSQMLINQFIQNNVLQSYDPRKNIVASL